MHHRRRSSVGTSGSLIQHAPPSAEEIRNASERDDAARPAAAKLHTRECAIFHGAQRERIGEAPPIRHRRGPRRIARQRTTARRSLWKQTVTHRSLTA